MRRVEYSDKASGNFADLARECRDEALLDELKKQIETIAEFPSIAEPAKFPHTGGHMWNGHLHDSTDRMWGFTILLFIRDDALFVRLIRFGRAPLHFNE